MEDSMGAVESGLSKMIGELGLGVALAIFGFGLLGLLVRWLMRRYDITSKSIEDLMVSHSDERKAWLLGQEKRDEGWQKTVCLIGENVKTANEKFIENAVILRENASENKEAHRYQRDEHLKCAELHNCTLDAVKMLQKEHEAHGKVLDKISNTLDEIKEVMITLKNK
jgi:hypothetical protein